MFYLGITSFPAAMPGKEKYLHKLKSLGEQKKRERDREFLPSTTP